MYDDVERNGSMKNFSDLIRQKREAKGWTQKELAQRLYVSDKTISRWETGMQMMGVDKYVVLAEHYNISVDYLLGLTDLPKKLHEK